MHRRVFILVVLGALSLSAQQLTSDPNAIALVQHSVAAMGGSVPADTSASGRVEIFEGSRTEAGSIRILTRGLEQTLEEIKTDKSERKLTFSRNEVKSDNLRSDTEPQVSSKNSTELALGSRSVFFPLALLAEALRNTDSAFEYVGLETLNNTEVHHVRFRNTFQSKRGWQRLSPLTARDVWIDAKSALPSKLSYSIQEGRGIGSDSVRIEVLYSDFRDSGGFLYPWAIERLANGTLWMKIHLERVKAGNNLADTDFRIK